MFPYPCPSCNQRLLAPEDRAGQRTICPKCLRPLTIPRPDASMQDPNTLVDPTEAPLPLQVMADTHTPYPGTIAVPYFAPVAVSAATAVGAAPAYRAASNTGDLTFDLPDVPVHARSGFSSANHPRPNIADTPSPSPAQPTIASRRQANRDAHGMVMLNPTGMFSVDVGAELSAALSMRMNPPPEPAVDRRLILGAWAFGTLAALGLWLAGLFYNPECLPFVALLGGAMLFFGLTWRAYLVSREESLTRGLLCLVPPLSLYRLFQKAGDNGHRPLRFAASGAVVLALFATSAPARTFVGTTFSDGAKSGLDSTSPAAKIRGAGDEPAKLTEVLRELGTPDAAKKSIGDDRAATILELNRLLKHEQIAVRIAAGQALLEWSPAEADKWLLAALGGKDSVDFRTALAVAAKSHEPEVAAAVASKLLTRESRPDAARCLLAIGKPAETPVIDLLDSKVEVAVLSAIDVLTEIGGPKSLAALNRLAGSTKSATVKSEAEQAAEQLGAKVGK